MGTSDGRRTTRRRVLKEGRVITLDNQSVINCLVRDLSATGARIKCGDPVAVPNAFRLQVGQELTMRPAQVVWRRGEYVGLVFTGDAIPAPRGLQI